jgi:hypothetical protein
VDSANRILTAQLAQGDRLTTRVSSYMNGDDLVRLGVWQWMVEQSGQASPVTRHLPWPD